MTLWRMRIACWILKVTNSHIQVVQYSFLSTATMVARSATVLHYTYIACLVQMLQLVVGIDIAVYERFNNENQTS